MNRNLLGGLALLAASCFGPSDLVAQETPSVARRLTLGEAIRMTLGRAPELALARTESERAGEALRETRSLNLPQVVTGTGLAYNNGFPLSLEGSAPSVVQLGFSQSILSKRNNNLVREAREGHRASLLAVESTREELASKVALLYFDLHQARKLEVLWQTRLESARNRQQVTGALLEEGRVRPLDWTLAQADTAAAGQQLLVARERARIAQSALRQQVGLAEGTDLQTVEPRFERTAPEAADETLYQRALESNPEIQRAEAALRAREYHLEAERGEYYPRFDLVGQYAVFSRYNNYQDYFNRFDRNNYILGMSIQVPIFNGNRTAARVAQSRKEVVEAKLRLDRLKAELRLGIERGTSQLRIARGAADLAQLEASAARESFEIHRALFDAGRLDARRLESERLQLHASETAALEAESVLWQREIELLLLTRSTSVLY